jgi:uncharacterized membrane protein
MSSMLPLLADGAENFPWPLGVLGRFHFAVIHYPIALLSIATLFELWHAFRKRPGTAPGSVALTVLAAVGAAVSSLFGWFLEEFDGHAGTDFELHKWLGIWTSLVAATAAGVALYAESGRLLLVYRIKLVIATLLVGLTGYVGGNLVHGDGHYFKGTPLAPAPPPPPPAPPAPPPAPPSGAVSDKVDFAKEIAPLFKASCLECHGPKKVKGKFRLDTKEAAMKGGNQKNAIVPGNPGKSLVFTLLSDPDPETRMPPDDKGPLPKDKIELIQKWIAEGAVWPDGVLIQ